jgi:AAA15 family ATPase/GTPase
VNEGFLFLLFYVCLIVSKETPSFFAIDNLEASFHPKLCEELTKNLISLGEHHNKQIILTTHNPFVLDGLDLNDKNQSLFVVRRNSDGETIANKVDGPPKNVKLSEAWMRGYIGGQPETIE